MRTRVWFKSHDIRIAGMLYVPDDYDGRRLIGIVVCHPAGGVKEQTSGLYSEELSRRGFAALTFDAARQGESDGVPRGLEDPFQRAEDIRSAVSYLSALDFVDENHIGILGICAAGSYVSYTAQTDWRMKAVATVSAVDPSAEFLENPETRGFLLEQAGALRNLEARTGLALATHVNPGTRYEAEQYPEKSMFREAFDYYGDGPNKHPNASGWGLLQYDVLAHYLPFEHMEWIAPRPVLMIVGSDADSRHFSENAVAKAGTNAELFEIQGATHMDLYCKEPYFTQAVDKLTAFYRENLKSAE